MVIAPKQYAGETVVCLGGGPSLTQADVDRCRGRARVIAVNDAYRLAPWAEVLYGCDTRWWRWQDGAPAFAGQKWSLDGPNWATLQNRFTDIALIGRGQTTGLSLDPGEICTGSNSGYQAINLAVLFGARRIVLLGYDLQATDGLTHWFGSHPEPYHEPPPFALYLQHFPTLVAPLQAAGVELINATRETALTCFPRVDVDAIFPVEVPA